MSSSSAPPVASSVPPTPEGSGPRQRTRSSSITQAIADVNTYTDGANKKAEMDKEKRIYKQSRQQNFFWDVLTFRWMINPSTSGKLVAIVLVLYANWAIFTPHLPNPFERFIFISHRVPLAQVALKEPGAALRGDTVRWQKGWNDLYFVGFYIVVYSFIRQSTTLYVFKPFAKWWGIKNETKQQRLMEQGYSFLYWGTYGVIGLFVMRQQPTWWFRLDHMWYGYPRWQLRTDAKYYYLLQASYWTQQALVMLLRLEKPRKDYYELIAHHLVTLWLIFWSYLVNVTSIGVPVFVCMDVPDAFLAAAKGLNYLGLDTIATAVFGSLMFIWAYFRIYLSAKILVSVWTEFWLIPKHTMEWNPPQGWWLVPWMRYQIFAPLFILLLLNLFWFVLMWRVMIRALKGVVKDDREDGEYDDEDGDEKKSKKE